MIDFNPLDVWDSFTVDWNRRENPFDVKGIFMRDINDDINDLKIRQEFYRVVAERDMKFWMRGEGDVLDIEAFWNGEE